jgi:hypothetical protein
VLLCNTFKNLLLRVWAQSAVDAKNIIFNKNMETIGRWTNKFLMFNLFLVFFFFAWLLVALGGETLKVNLGLELWRQLWEPLIQPVLGIVMAGAIASGVISKVKQKIAKP